MGQLCSEFGCLPSQLEKEDPTLIRDIAFLRSYARAKSELDHAKSEGDIKHTAMVDRVWSIQHQIMKDRMAKRGT